MKGIGENKRYASSVERKPCYIKKDKDSWFCHETASGMKAPALDIWKVWSYYQWLGWLGMHNTPSASLLRVKIPRASVLYMTLNNLMVRIQ